MVDEMLRVWLSNPDGGVELDVDADRISDMLADPDSLFWVDLHEPTQEEFEVLKTEFEFHPLAVEDAYRRNQRPKLDTYDDFSLIVLYSVEFNEQKVTID